MLRYSILFFLLIICNLTFGQKNWATDYTDSLIALSQKPGCKVVDSLYMEIGHVLAYSNPVKSIGFLEEAIDISTSKGNYPVACMAHSFLGIAYSHVGMFDNAVQEFQNQLSIAKEYNIVNEICWAYSNIGHTLLVLKNYEIAKTYLLDAKVYAENGFDEIAHYIYFTMGRLMRETGQPDSAIFYLNKSLEIRKRPPADPTKLSDTYRYIGDVYFNNNDFSKAKYYYGTSASLVDSTISDIPALTNVKLAIMYLQEGLNDSAYICAQKALNTAMRFRHKMVLGQAYGVLGSLYFNQGKAKEAERYFTLQINYQDSVKNRRLSKRIYNLQYKKEILDMQEQIKIQKSNTRKVVTLSLMMLLFVIGGVILTIRFRKKDKMIKSMNLKIDEQNRQTNESIHYAKKIQQAIIPRFESVMPSFTDKFLLFKPKLKVSGNFYWSHSNQDLEIIAIGDSGEFGVPGALMSMLGSSILHEIAEDNTDPARILYLLRERVLQIISKINPLSDAGKEIDMSVAVFNRAEKILDFSGIKFPMLIIHEGELFPLLDNQETKTFYNMDFSTISVTLYDGDCIYMMTNGYSLQTNNKGKEYSSDRLFKYLRDIHKKPMEEQKSLLINEFSQWRGNNEQERDLLITGFCYQENNTETSNQESQTK